MSTQTPKFYRKNTTTAHTINIYRLLTGAMTFNSNPFGTEEVLANKPIQSLQFQVMPVGAGTFHVDLVANDDLTDFNPSSRTTIASNKTQNDWILIDSQQIMFNQITLVNTTTTSFTLVLGVWGTSN